MPQSNNEMSPEMDTEVSQVVRTWEDCPECATYGTSLQCRTCDGEGGYYVWSEVVE